MIGINDVVEELVDDVFIRQSKSMDNNELTIEQLQAVNGSAAYVKLDGFRAAQKSPLSPDAKKKDLLAERTFSWLAAPWHKQNTVSVIDFLFGD